MSVTRPQKFHASHAVAFYMMSSVGMTVANKRAVGSFHAGTVLLGIQLLATCVIVILLWACGMTRIEGTRSAMMTWAPTGLLSGGVMWAGMQALKHASLSTLTVVRNASPLFLLLAEWRLFHVKPSKSATLSLLVILTGVCIYTWDDLQVEHGDVLGIVYIALDAFLVCIDGMLERYLLALKPVELSTGALVLISNGVGLLPVILLLMGPCAAEWSEIHIDTSSLIWGCLTLPGGALMSYSSVFLRCSVSATAALVVANADKILILGYGILCMKDQMNILKTSGCALALLGSAWHAWARVSSEGRVASEESGQAFLDSAGCRRLDEREMGARSCSAHSTAMPGS
eukprot:TRINITY_DN110586_c0_g1_i1.p1 TRINITY_DN110586_c0_g1~~TRINITY_DN110586_c0_g1_i1.p1  ORF type:complete len:344 (-),score=26.30 TRINITY_DN110586_c0_g1_i1:12-1043(-)